MLSLSSGGKLLFGVGAFVSPSIPFQPSFSSSSPQVSPLSLASSHLSSYRPEPLLSMRAPSCQSRLITRQDSLITEGAQPGLRRSTALYAVQGRNGGDEHSMEPRFFESIGSDRQRHAQTVNTILQELCGGGLEGNQRIASIERAMEHWLAHVHLQGGAEQSEPLSCVRCCLVNGVNMERQQFLELYQVIEQSEVAQHLLLDLAILFGCDQVVAWLLEAGVSKGDNTLNLMIQCKNAHCVEQYLEHHSDTVDLNRLTSAQDEPWAEAPLHKAVKTGSLEVVSALLAGGGDINCPDESGVTPLLIAASSGDTSMAELLLERGADPLLESLAGETPLALAIERVASKPMYDIENAQWRIDADELDERRLVLLDQVVDTLFDHYMSGALPIEKSATMDCDRLIFRLMSCIEDQSDNLSKLFAIRNQGAAHQEAYKEIHRVKPLQCMSKKLAEPIIAAGHISNIQMAVEKMKLQLLLETDQAKDYIDHYRRDDLGGLI